MVTYEQAVNAQHGDEFHYTGNHDCTRAVGPRGGVCESITRARVTGKCRTWKRKPYKFRLPVKHGLYESGAIDDCNRACWHRAEDCPLIPRFKVTGTLPNGKRFKAIHTENRIHALSFNIYNGHVWEMVDGKWKIIKSVSN
jgi:hypothetical protein